MTGQASLLSRGFHTGGLQRSSTLWSHCTSFSFLNYPLNIFLRCRVMHSWICWFLFPCFLTQSLFKAFVFPAWPFVASVWVWHPLNSGQPVPEPKVSKDYLKTKWETHGYLLIWDQEWFILCLLLLFLGIYGWREKPEFVFAGMCVASGH